MQKLKLIFVLAFITLTFVQCKKDGDSDKNEVSIEITDAPSDNTNVKGAFVTVTEIRLDGQKMEGFSKQTIDLMAYQNGQTKALGSAEFDAKAYNNVTLVLDNAADADGNSPGCYILTTDGTKKSLTANASGTTEITSAAAVENTSKSNIVLDFDVRKAIKSEGSSDYRFVTTAELNSSVRATMKEKTGTIKGKCTNNTSSNTKIVAYAYKKGTYSTAEKSGQGSSSIQFKNATTSALVDGSGNYQLSFLNEGEYDVYFASYETDNSGKVSFKGMCQVGALLSGIISSSTTVNANASVSLNVSVSAIL